MRLLKAALLTILFCVGVFFLLFLFTPARFQPTTKIDFMQDHLAARTILDGENPYQPLDQLANKYGAPGRFQHLPTPHPPIMLLLLTPLGWLSYPMALLVWFMVSLLSLSIALKLLLNFRTVQLVMAVPIAVIWYPLHADLGNGQMMCLELGLLTLSWYFLRKQQDVICGLALGLAVSIKLISWPIILFLILKKNWTAAFAGISTFILANLIAIPFLGLRAIADYYLHVGGSVTHAYIADPLNFALSGLGYRLFAGTNGVMVPGMSTEPLVYLPQIALWVSMPLVGLTLVVGLWMIRKYDLEPGFAAMIALSVITSPLTWWYYSTLLVLPLCVAFKKGYRYALLPILVLPYVPWLVRYDQRLTFWQGMLLMAPLLSPLLLILYGWFGLARPNHKRMVNP